MLDSGAVVCRIDTPTPGVRFSVETPLGRITAKGTVFAVAHLPGGEVAVRVHRGVVEVESAQGARDELRAPAAAVLGRAIRGAPTTGQAWHRDAELIEAADLWADGAVAPVDIAASPVGALVALDGVSLGESPVSTLLGRGEHELVVRRPGLATHRERFVVRGAERISRTPELEALPEQPEPAGANASSAAAAAATPPSAAELLARARSLRSSGRYAAAATAYQNLLSTHPRSSEANAALISLAELQLSQLGQTAAALRSFDAYLAHGGSLAQEARYGRIRALRRLGRTEEARTATEAFLRAYPGSAQAKALRKRSGSR
jgi:tetratricopeptide (TPR) repeat protein